MKFGADVGNLYMYLYTCWQNFLEHKSVIFEFCEKHAHWCPCATTILLIIKREELVAIRCLIEMYKIHAF